MVVVHLFLVLVVFKVRVIVVVLAVPQPRGQRHNSRARLAKERRLLRCRGYVRIEDEQEDGI